jgi:hypothetical protein
MEGRTSFSNLVGSERSSLHFDWNKTMYPTQDELKKYHENNKNKLVRTHMDKIMYQLIHVAQTYDIHIHEYEIETKSASLVESIVKELKALSYRVEASRNDSKKKNEYVISIYWNCK